MQWVVMGFEGTGKQVVKCQGREDLRLAKYHKTQEIEETKAYPKKIKVTTGSFVAAFIRRASVSCKEYFPGPNIWGNDCDNIFRDAVKWFIRNMPKGDIKVCLTGYSRGAYIAMCFAKYLDDAGIDVEFMGLFDPVKRDRSMACTGPTETDYSTSVISNNVRNVRVSYRADYIGSRNLSMNSAESFFPIAKFYESGKRTPKEKCPGSHGALGGFPNGAGPGDFPMAGQGDPNNAMKFHPRKEWTAWWKSGNFISNGAIDVGLPVKRLVPADGGQFCIPESQWNTPPKRLPQKRFEVYRSKA